MIVLAGAQIFIRFFMETWERNARILEAWIQGEIEDTKSGSKEALLLLDTFLIESVLVYSSKLQVTHLARHAAVSILAFYLRTHYNRKNPTMWVTFPSPLHKALILLESRAPSSKEMTEVILTCIFISSKVGMCLAK
jgi:hypothetical protein